MHVQDLTASIGQDDRDLSDTLAALTTALRSTATSYCGFQLIVENQWPVTLTAFDDGHDAPGRDVAASPPRAGFADSRWGEPSRLLRRHPWRVHRSRRRPEPRPRGIPVNGRSSTANNADHHGTRLDGHRRVIEIDADLPPGLPRVQLTGLAELTC